MSNYPYIPSSTIPPWEFEDLQDIESYNANPYQLKIGNKLFNLIVDCEANGHRFLDNFADEGDDPAAMVYTHVTVACEGLDFVLDGFDAKTFIADVASADEEDQLAALIMLRTDLYSNGGIALEEV